MKPIPPANVLTDIPLGRLTTWNVGGNAEFFIEPASITALTEAARWAYAAGIPLTIIGRGSNILIDSSGVPGLTICLRKSLQGIEWHEGFVRAEAGCPCPTLSATAGDAGWGGFDFLIGIPGTVGAAIAINAGLGGNPPIATESILLQAQLYDPRTGETSWEPASRLDLRYRHSNIPDRGLIVLAGDFALRERVDVAESRAHRRRHLDYRAATQPLNRRTCGSVWKGVDGGRPAGWYIDQAGLKELAVGDACISPKHANWIENRGTATSDEIKQLMRTVEDRIFAQFGIRLEREVRFIPDSGVREP